MQMLLTMFACPTHHLGVEQGHYSQALPVTAWDLVRRIPLSWALTSHTVGERETLFGMLDFFSNSSVSNTPTTTAPPAAQIIINGLTTTALPVQIVFAKFGMHLPLHRQSKDFARLGCEIAKSTMCSWLTAFAFFFGAVLKALEKQMLASNLVYSDDISEDTLDPGSRKTKIIRFWSYLGHGPDGGLLP